MLTAKVMRMMRVTMMRWARDDDDGVGDCDDDGACDHDDRKDLCNVGGVMMMMSVDDEADGWDACRKDGEDGDEARPCSVLGRGAW